MYLLLYILILAAATQALDEEEINKKIELENEKFSDNERRFNENLNDEDWHVAHLKSTDFEETRRSGCQDLSFNEKVKKYRKSLAKDAGHLKYVYAQPLPFNERELDETECKVLEELRNGTNSQNSTLKNKTESTSAKHFRANASDDLVIKTTTESGANKSVDANKSELVANKSELVANKSEATTNKSESIRNKTESIANKTEKTGNKSESIANISEEEKNSPEADVLKPKSSEEVQAVVDTATTIPIDKKKKKIKKKAENIKRRDYLFSSAEYDDDVMDFDGSECPDMVEVINLELDLIRTYDVDCELSLQWRSLD